MHLFITVKLGCQRALLIQNIPLLGRFPVYKPKKKDILFPMMKKYITIY